MSDELSKNPMVLTKGEIIENDVVSYRNQVIKEYRANRGGIKSAINRTGTTVDEMMMVIAEEILEESEVLLGNELITTEEGDIDKATNISVKRASVLKTVADILARKREINQKDADVDLNGPAFQVFQRLCFEKMTATLEELNFDKEMISLVLSKWAEKLMNWGKELKAELDKMN